MKVFGCSEVVVDINSAKKCENHQYYKVILANSSRETSQHLPTEIRSEKENGAQDPQPADTDT